MVDLLEVGVAVVLFFVGLGAALLVYARWYVKVPPRGVGDAPSSPFRDAQSPGAG